jgi:hypothetical protein
VDLTQDTGHGDLRFALPSVEVHLRIRTGAAVHVPCWGRLYMCRAGGGCICSVLGAAVHVPCWGRLHICCAGGGCTCSVLGDGCTCAVLGVAVHVP